MRIQERRPSFVDQSVMSGMTVVTMIHVGDGRWALQWADSNSKWHLYEGFENLSFAEALMEVDEDPTGIFFG